VPTTQYSGRPPVFTNMTAHRTLDNAHREANPDRSVSDVIAREQPRLKAWLRRQVPDAQDVEDILQDAFFEFVVAARLTEPIRHAGAWLFAVIRNRVTDRRRKAGRARDSAASQAANPVTTGLLANDEDHESLVDLLPDPAAGPEESYARKRTIQALEEAVLALPADQRMVFMAHEIDGISFKDMAQTSGESINTLLSRKHYAVKSLRQRLRAIRDDAAGA
jgi:RNA polymerase sigma factor (sigma-70 family)